MIIPSIDIQGGRAVQLVGGERLAIDAGDPIPIAEKFALAGEIAVVDLDAAMGTGDNSDLIARLLEIAPCRVGGGIRSADQALSWLRRGASKVVLGTAATPDLLAALPRHRVIAALDSRYGEVFVDGWRQATGSSVPQRMVELRELVSGFLVTFIESEGRLAGTQMDSAEQLASHAGAARITIAGGISSAAEIASLDEIGLDAQVGMALYSGDMTLAAGITAALQSDRPDGLWPTVITDRLGRALGLAYSNQESVEHACRTGQGVYFSRKRGLWVKGEQSGARQDLLRIDPDCDRDSLRFTVRQHGSGFCHQGTHNCWRDADGFTMLEETIRQRCSADDAGSYTRQLLNDPVLLKSKLLEEAGELADARSCAELRWEAADLAYFGMVAMASGGVDLAEVGAELKRRNLANMSPPTTDELPR